MSLFLQWATAATVLLSLLVTLYGLFHVVTIAKQDLDDWIRRLGLVEKKLEEGEQGRSALTTQTAAVTQKLTDLTAEITRLRDRLDRFLDSSTSR